MKHKKAKSLKRRIKDKWRNKKRNKVFQARWNIISGLATATIAIIEFIRMPAAETEGFGWLSFLQGGLLILVLCMNIRAACVHSLDRYEFEQIKKEDEFSAAALQALKNANDTKRRFILQSTYGNVPLWHPIDYIENVLVYDVHEQIRSILFELQRAIIQNVEGLTSNNVTVDFVYCYPNKEYKGDIPYPKYTEGKIEDETWRIITSGERSLGGSIKHYLGRHDSFFYHVDQQGYVFYNDKLQIANSHYIPSHKDTEHDKNGSILGLEIELRNDAPESVFIKGILTITTYGQKLYEKEAISEDDFKAALKENILNVFSSLILSELSQMYIRHAIRGGHICPRTGREIHENCVFSEPECYHGKTLGKHLCKNIKRHFGKS